MLEALQLADRVRQRAELAVRAREVRELRERAERRGDVAEGVVVEAQRAQRAEARERGLVELGELLC